LVEWAQGEDGAGEWGSDRRGSVPSKRSAAKEEGRKQATECVLSQKREIVVNDEKNV
jgi:hypothetical protein